MKINGIEVDFKISRLKDATAFELALSDMEKTELQNKKETGNVPLSRMIPKVLKMFKEFFVTATGNDVLSDCDDLAEAKKAYLDFLKSIQEQKKELLDTFSSSRIK